MMRRTSRGRSWSDGVCLAGEIEDGEDVGDGKDVGDVGDGEDVGDVGDGEDVGDVGDGEDVGDVGDGEDIFVCFIFVCFIFVCFIFVCFIFVCFIFVCFIPKRRFVILRVFVSKNTTLSYTLFYFLFQTSRLSESLLQTLAYPLRCSCCCSGY
jgi:hypothetical protein